MSVNPVAAVLLGAFGGLLVIVLIAAALDKHGS